MWVVPSVEFISPHLLWLKTGPESPRTPPMCTALPFPVPSATSPRRTSQCTRTCWQGRPRCLWCVALESTMLTSGARHPAFRMGRVRVSLVSRCFPRWPVHSNVQEEELGTHFQPLISFVRTTEADVHAIALSSGRGAGGAGAGAGVGAGVGGGRPSESKLPEGIVPRVDHAVAVSSPSLCRARFLCLRFVCWSGLAAWMMFTFPVHRTPWLGTFQGRGNKPWPPSTPGAQTTGVCLYVCVCVCVWGVSAVCWAPFTGTPML
jgi:hypothetical protein